MRQLLNNPWVVLGLCSGAVVILYFSADEIAVQQVVPQLIGSQEGSGVPAEPLLPVEKTKIDLAQLDWPTTLTRDPFAPLSHVTNAELVRGEDGPQYSHLETSSNNVIPSLRLTAVAMEPEPKVAMINRKLVAEGDRIEGLRVARIESDGVWLNGPSGSPHHLVFEERSGKTDTVERREKVLSISPKNSHEGVKDLKDT